MRAYRFTKSCFITSAFLKNLWDFTEHNFQRKFLVECFWFLRTVWTHRCFISNKSPNWVWLPATAVQKRLAVFASEICKDNQNMAKVKNNILLMRSTQQKKEWYLVEAFTTQTWFEKKCSEILDKFKVTRSWKYIFLMPVFTDFF